MKSDLEAIIRAYKQKLETLGIPVDKIILFGSRAKQTARSDSDIDLCIVSKAFGKDYHQEMVQLLKVAHELTLDQVIEPHPYHPLDLTDRYDSLAAEINSHGITIIA